MLTVGVLRSNLDLYQALIQEGAWKEMKSAAIVIRVLL